MFVCLSVGHRENRTKVRDFVANIFARQIDTGPDTDKTTNTHDVKWRRTWLPLTTRPPGRPGSDDPRPLTDDPTQNLFAAFAFVEKATFWQRTYINFLA